MTAGQHIDYDALALEALRGVVKGALTQVARTGLVGDHHFYIAFNTQAPNVGLSKRLKEKYPDEMTIVLQHRFWDLLVEDDRFEVKLTFDSIPERLVIPFKAIKVFYDPSVPYGLQFEEVEPNAAPDAARRTTRRTVGLAKDGDPRDAMTRPGSMTAGARRNETEADLEVDRLDGGGEDRRRPAPRRSRTDRAGGQETGEAERSDRRLRPVEKPLAPVPAKPSVVVAVGGPDEAVPTTDDDIAEAGKAEDAVSEVGDGDGDASGGAKIFDLAKFRSKK